MEIQKINKIDCYNLKDLVFEEARRFTNIVYCSIPYVCCLEEFSSFYKDSYIPVKFVTIIHNDKETIFQLKKGKATKKGKTFKIWTP